MANPKLRDRLHRITPPTLILWGEADAIVSPDYRAAWAAAMPQAAVETIADAGHRLHADQPAAFAARVAQFAER
jgi:pimeloyl-ACP methyl ester carboxylesterase